MLPVPLNSRSVGVPIRRGKLRLTPRTKRVMEMAAREANRLEQNYVGTEHLLFGILAEGTGMAVQILEIWISTRPRVPAPERADE